MLILPFVCRSVDCLVCSIVPLVALRLCLITMGASAGEHAALKANHPRSLAFVTSEHPSLDVGALVVGETLLDILLK